MGIVCTSQCFDSSVKSGACVTGLQLEDAVRHAVTHSNGQCSRPSRQLQEGMAIEEKSPSARTDKVPPLVPLLVLRRSNVQGLPDPASCLVPL
jgi:hypothetical protein